MKKIQIQLFGNLKITIDDVVIDLEASLGKQLSTLFALIVCNRNQTLSKEMLIDTLWTDSENPLNALKVSVFRLRNIIKDIPVLNEYEWIVTSRKGYVFNGEIDASLDIEDFENYIFKAKEENNINYYQEALTLYSDSLLCNLTADWVSMDRNYYKSLFIQAAEQLCRYKYDKKEFDQASAICKKAFSVDPYVEDIIYIYIKSLIANKQYNIALSFYENISKQFLKEMGIELQLEKKTLFDLEDQQKQKNLTMDMQDYIDEMHEDIDLNSPYYCDYEAFKSIVQYEIRNSQRDNKKKHLLVINVVENCANLQKIMQLLVKIIDNSLRSSDVYTRLSGTQYAIILNLSNEVTANRVVDRIRQRFLERMPSEKSNVLFVVENIVTRNKESQTFSWRSIYDKWDKMI